MARNSFNSLLRCCVVEMYTAEGIKTVEHVAGYGLSGEAKEILAELVKLIMETEYCKPDTKEFLSSKFRSYRNSANGSGCAGNKHTSRSRINYDLLKLRVALGQDAMDIIIKQKGADLTRYKEKIQSLLLKHKQKSLLEGFTIKLPGCNEPISSITGDEMMSLIGLARMHSRKGIQEDEKRITANMVGYIKYLEQNQESLQGEELECFQALSEWLK